jgi:hypothetical protein
MTESSELVCPHCKKPFTGEPLGDGAGGPPRGYKCPHCRLYVPVERAAQDGPTQA